ncbi:MAG: CHAT domain-containing protein [Magnetococcales bacterium]|nr:CHAT domain-containing protein [Magnetococcales bacterium]
MIALGLLLGSSWPLTALAASGAPDEKQRAGAVVKPANAEKTTGNAPLLTPPPAPPAAQNDPTAAKEAEAGKKAMQANDFQQAMTRFAKAHERDPGHKDWLHNAATASLQAGETAKALEYFRKAATLAAKGGDTKDAAMYNGEISRMVNTMPPWVDETLNQAGVIPASKAEVAGVWSKTREEAMAAAEKGDLDTAIRLGKQAADLARENLGAQHASTFMSERELGTYLTLMGKVAEAEPLLKQAATHAQKALGPNHPESLATGKALAELLETQNNPAAARDMYQAARGGWAAKIGAGHPLAMDNDLALARLLQELGSHDEAETMLREVCSRSAGVHGYHHPETARCLERFAALNMAREAFPMARDAYEQSLTILEAILPKEDPTPLATRIGAAEANRRLGELKRAEALLKPVLARLPAGTKDPLTVEATTARIHLLADQSDFQEAENQTRKLLKELAAEQGEEHPSTLALRVELATILEKRGDLAAAETLLKTTLESLTKTLGESHPVTITTLNNLGQLLEQAGLYDDAEPVLRRALELAQKQFGPERPITLTTMNNLALLHESQGNFDKAEPLYHNAIDAYRKRLGERHVDTVAVINNLAYLHLLQREEAKAAPLFRQALESWSATLGGRHPRTLKALNNLARVTHHLGQHQEAEKLFTKALEGRRKTLGERHPDVIRSMNDLSLLLRDMGRHKEAEELARQARAKAEEAVGPLHPYAFEVLETLASILEKTKHPDAFKVRKELFIRRSDFLDRMLWSTGDNAREGYIRLHAPELNTYLTRLGEMDPATGGREAFEVGLRRKGLLLKITSEIRQIARLGNDPALKAISERLTETRKRLASLTLSGPTPETASTHLKVIHDLENDVERLQLELGRASKRLQHTTTPITLDTLVKHLPEKAALVEFLAYKDEERSGLQAAIVFQDKGKVVFDRVVYPDPDGVQKIVTDYRAIIQEEEADEESIKKMGRTAYDRIWAPIKQRIGKREQVYVVPDGMLNILPFPALVNPEDDYLARDTDLHLLSSSRDLVPSAVPEAKGNYLILAGPDYDSDKVGGDQAKKLKAKEKESESLQGRRSSELKQGLRAFSSGMRGLHFDPLPGAEKEGRLISGQATGRKKNNTVLMKHEAQESALQSLATPPEILHIATHGFFLKPDDNLKKRLLKLARGGELKLPPPGDNPLLRAGLAFAGINANARFLGELDTDNDGVLTALEVLGMDLTGTRLAVLSACETGLGEMHEGEGVYGLRRAFQEAGAKSVIASLWEVSDAGTQALMTNLYARLGEGMSAHRALRESQLDLLESSEWKHPYIWSAFMMVGE